MARCLVVGGNGFLGARLADELAESGHEVSAFDRFSRGHQTFKSARVKRIVGDFLSRADLESAVNGQDFVFHFLSTTTPATADSEPTLDIRTNISQSVELLELAAEAGVSRFFYASSGGAIYGAQPDERYSEDMPLAPISPYGIGKLAVERYLEYFSMKNGLRSTSLRISNPYGANSNTSKRQGIIPIVLNRIQDGEPIVKLGDGSMVRDYIYVDDLIARVVRMLDTEPQHPVYNLGSGQGHSVNQVLDAIRSVTGEDFDVVTAPKPPTFVDRVILDVGRYREEYGTHPDLSLHDGISRTWMEMKG